MARKVKILVTGAAGFMGSHLAEFLSKKGFTVHTVDDLSGGFLRNLHDRKNFRRLDLRDRNKTAAYVKKIKPEIIFHLAADATEGRSQFTPFSAVDRNILSYMNLLVPAIKNGLDKMILMSSMSVYGTQQVPFIEDMVVQPEDVYGASKADMEAVTKAMAGVFGFKYVIIRPHNVYGPKQNIADPYRNVIGIFINRLLQGKSFFIYGDGKQKRAFSYIDDITEATYKAAFSKKCEGRILNLGSDQPVTLKELAELVLWEFFGSGKIPAKFRPSHLAPRPLEVKYAYADHSLARKFLGFKDKTSLREGIRKMIRWARATGPQKFRHLERMEIENELTPKTWSKKLM